MKAELLFKAPWRSGVAHADVTPDKFLARLCALVPPPGPSTALALRRDHHDPKLLHTLPSDGDPQEFTISSGGSEFLTITGITSATPNIKTATATDPQAFLKLILTATQGTSGNALRSSKSPTAPPPSSSPPAAPEPVANLPARAYAPLMPRGPTCHVDAS